MPTMMPRRWVLLIAVGVLTTLSSDAYSQHGACDLDQLEMKYRRYRTRLTRSFIKIDRHESGCIGDGIGQAVHDPCAFEKAGYSLPATALVISWSGIDALKNRNQPRNGNPFLDIHCADGVHWDQKNAIRFNYLDIGSETPSQLGWYMVMLCMEYERYRLMNQADLQRRSLEELYLALQALRRLDMQAQCAAEKLYEHLRLNNKQRCCEKYFGRQKGLVEIHSFLTSGRFSPSCDFKKQLDGYNGFFIRADAPQSLREDLHDESHEWFHVDAIDCDYARTEKPCSRQSINERACYLYHQQAYMSQDQIFGLLNGLVFVRKFIPAHATVTLCDGSVHPVLEIAKKYTRQLVNRIDSSYKNRIVFPGILNCVEGLTRRQVKDKLYFSNFEGGQTSYIMYPLKKIKDYVCDEKSRFSKSEATLWWVFKNWAIFSSPNASFYVMLSTLSDPEPSPDFMIFCRAENKEIYLLLHALLHEEYRQEILQELDIRQWYHYLCRSPYDGHCTKQKKYPPDSIHLWPRYPCQMSSGWLGQRWEGPKRNAKLVYHFDEKHKDAWPPNRIFNGLDFINYYLLYRLLVE